MKNTSYKKDRPQLTETQILNNKDYNATLKKVTSKGNSYIKSIKYLGAGGLATIVILASLYFFNKETSIKPDTYDESFTYQPTNKLDQISAIKPPFEEYNVDYEIFKIDCAKNETVTTKSGTIFEIPKNSLIDIEGNSISGIAEIHYRELRNPVDFFLSGIPMDYDSAGTNYTFESAGMIDIKAYQNETVLLLAKNKIIDFQFNSTTPDNGYNFYSLNESTGDWTFENQCLDTKNEVENKITKQLPGKIGALNTSILNAPVKQDKINYSLNISVNTTNYPELERFEGTIFEINEINKPFDPVNYKIQWENAALSDSEIEGNYTLKLSREDSSIYLTVYPVVKDKFYEKAIKEYNQELKAYKKSINNKPDDFDAYTKSKDLTTSNNINNEIRSIFYNENRDKISFYEIAAGPVSRIFSIAALGIVNIDMPMPKMKQPNQLAKNKTVNNHGDRISVENYFVANSQRNAIENFEFDNGIRYHRQGETVVWFIDESGFISIVHPDEFKDIEKSDELKFNTYPTRKGIDVLRNLMAYK